MRTILIVVAILCLPVTSAPHAQDMGMMPQGMPIGMSGDYETVRGKVVKVYSAEDNGAHFRAYAVNWKEYEVILTDPLGTTDKQVGDEVTFLAQRIEFPDGNETIRMLQFMIMEFPEIPAPKGPTTPTQSKN